MAQRFGSVSVFRIALAVLRNDSRSRVGTALVTISGAVAAPGVYELAFGTPMHDLVAAAGGPAEPLQALLVGGYFGTWVESSRAMTLRLAREDLRSVGCALGSGVVIALGEGACGLHESARVIDYLARQSAGSNAGFKGSPAFSRT